MFQRFLVVVIGALSCWCIPLQAQGGESDGTRVEPLPRTLEVNLALSAAPPYLRADATVYVLDPAKGYVLERKGVNGFTCYVERTDYLREDFGNDFIVPECHDPEGSRTIVPVEFDIERLRAEGQMSPSQLKQEIMRRFTVGVYQVPRRTGIAYMLSPIAKLYNGPHSKTTVTMNMPHFMFFAPNLTEKDVGSGQSMNPYPYLINPGPMGYIILNSGEAEKAAINRASQELLKETCAYRADLCLEGITPDK